jgi:hypothetical protein
VTSCGLFLRYQERLAAAVAVPVATSAVLFLPFLSALLPRGRTVGVLTADASILSAVIEKAGWNDPGQVVLEGMEACPVFRRAILDPVPPFELDPVALQREVVQAAGTLLRREPKVDAILVECTNLSPYSHVLRETFRLPVFDVIDLACLLRRATCGERPSIAQEVLHG